MSELPDSVGEKLRQLQKKYPIAENEWNLLVNELKKEFVKEKAERKKAKYVALSSIGFTLISTIIGLLAGLPRVSAIIEYFLFGS